MEAVTDEAALDDVAREELALVDRQHNTELEALKAKQVADRDRLVKRLERDTRRRRETAARLDDGERWTPADGKTLLISQMTPGHAGRARDMLLREAADWQERATGRWWMQRDDASGPTTTTLTAEDWLRERPTFKALEARAAEPATWRDRRLDRRARKAYEKRGRRA